MYIFGSNHFTTVIIDVTLVRQRTQKRLFKYDALSRLTHEKQVEAVATLNNDGVKVATGGQWTGVYKYDTQSLLSEGTDARGVKTSFVYDGLNRVSTVTYSGEIGFTTPNVTYTYDEAHANYFNKGRLTKVQTAVNVAQDTPETKQIYDYDNIGQVVNHTQSIGNQSYNLMYGYNLAGQLTSEKYPSGKVFNYTVDDYGRLATVADNQRSYLNSVSFNDKGLLSNMNLGNGTSQSFNYNDRFQMTSQQLSKGSEVLQKYDYGYGKVDLANGTIDATKNNGQLGRIESFIGTQKQAQQRFEYDSIGRLSESREYKGTDNSLTYKQHFDFDRFGNLYRKTISTPNAGQANPLPYTPIEETDISKATNKYTTGTTYDDSGAVISDNKFRQMNFAYDANGRMVKAMKANTPDAFSVYDALGNRIATKVDDVWQFEIYDAFGKLVAEYGGLSSNDEGGISYNLQDWQGSVRASVSNSGFVKARFDFTAFGEEINLGIGLRSAGQGYSGNATTKQGYGLTEKDSTGLNHTWFRRMQSGKFCYLAYLQDKFLRRIVGWKVSERMTAQHVIDVFNQARKRYLIKKRAIIQTDRGSQYASVEYRRLLYINGSRQSMSGKGNCYDNAQAESFFSRFKAELLENGKFEDAEQAGSEIFTDLEGYYNRTRIHANPGKSPLEFEKELKIENKQRSRESFYVSLNLTSLSCVSAELI